MKITYKSNELFCESDNNEGKIPQIVILDSNAIERVINLAKEKGLYNVETETGWIPNDYLANNEFIACIFYHEEEK
jgi:hypothetical protein